MTIRIIAGEFGGRRIKTPATDKVRPTADRVREAWFSILQGAIPGARVLDLFAGSGALGFEALSRGAVSVDFVEKHTASLRVIHANVDILNVADHVTIHRTDAIRFAERLPPDAYDVAFADPPYAGDEAPALAKLFRAKPLPAPPDDRVVQLARGQPEQRDARRAGRRCRGRDG